jgi:hypothetical protein
MSPRCGPHVSTNLLNFNAMSGVWVAALNFRQRRTVEQLGEAGGRQVF